MRYITLLVMCLCTILCVSSASAGPITDSIAYQGQLTDVSNNPVPDGTKDLILSIWTDSVGGTMLHSEVVVVTTSKGLFSTCLGCNGGTFPDIFSGQTLFLQTQLAGQPPMAPRTRLRSVPYSISSSSVHGESTDGVARSKGILAQRPGGSSGSGSSGFLLLLDADSDGDGVADFVVTDSVSTNGSSRVMSKDSDDDGDSDGDISFSMTPTTSSVAIKQKGTGADPNRVLLMRNRATPDELSSVSSIDDDGDTVPENEISQTLTPVSSAVAIKTKGTGADANRVVLISGSTGTDNALHRCEIDDDGDGVPESEISQSVTPTTSSVAIKTKGTGADPNRVITTTTPDSVVTEQTFEFTNSLLMPALMKAKEKANRTKCSNNLRYQSPVANNEADFAVDSAGSGLAMSADSDGDGIPEAKLSGKIVAGTFTGGPGTVSLQLADIDDDGIPEGEISETVLPTTSSVAIKTKGTGADANRTASITSSTAVGDISTLSAIDDDGDGVPEQSIEQSVSSTAVIVAWLSKKGYDYYQAAGRTSASLVMRDSLKDTTFFVDGDGRIGIGKPADAVKRIDVAGGAYCDGTTWVNASDLNAKENFQPVDGEELLEKISDLEITKWNYKGDTETEHIGPTAQDFKETFGVGSDGKSISTIDPSGIALAAIKELNKQNQMLQGKSTDLQKQNEQLRREMNELKAMIQKLASDK